MMAPGHAESATDPGGLAGDGGEDAGASTACPFSGIDTGIVREPDPELGLLTIDEFETLVRNEWRRRLGSASYRLVHSSRLVRALIVFALDPHSPVRRMVASQLILYELAEFGSAGLGRNAILREFRELPGAARQVLVVAGFSFDRSSDFAREVAWVIEDTITWDHRDTTKLTVIPKPVNAPV